MDISDLIIIITAFFIVFESICAPLDLDCRTWLKKSAASLNVSVHSFISSSTTDPFDFQVQQSQDFLKINIGFINMLAHLLIAFFLDTRASSTAEVCVTFIFTSNYMCSSFAAKSNSCHHSCQI